MRWKVAIEFRLLAWWVDHPVRSARRDRSMYETSGRRSATRRRSGYDLSRDSRTTNHAELNDSEAGHTNRDENPNVAWMVRNEWSQSLKGYVLIGIAPPELTLVPWHSGKIRASKSAFETGQSTSKSENGSRRKSLSKGTTFALFVAQKVSPKVSPTPKTTQGRECGLVLNHFATLSCVESG